MKELITKLRSAFIDVELSAPEANKIADALERLTAELGQAPEIQRMLMAENKLLHERHRNSNVILADLTAERDALRADAERYRWLRSVGTTETEKDSAIYVRWVQFTGSVMTASDVLTDGYLDDAIDAAITEEKK